MDPLTRFFLATGSILIGLITIIIVVGIITKDLPLDVALTTLSGLFVTTMGGIGLTRVANKDKDKDK